MKNAHLTGNYRFLKQEEITQYAVKNSCPELTWNLYGFPMPQVCARFEQTLELIFEQFGGHIFFEQRFFLTHFRTHL
jgi:hypothetical protein